LNRSRVTYGIFLVIWSLAAFWLSTGSLIHFHQWKIYGRPLLSQVVMHKREQEIQAKTLDLLKLSKAADAGKYFSPDQLALLPGCNPSSGCTVVSVYIRGTGLLLPDIPAAACTALRAPPLS
jgi:hypothetical protein